MSVKKRKKDSQIVASKGTGKAQALSAGIARMQKAGYKFVVIDSKELRERSNLCWYSSVGRARDL